MIANFGMVRILFSSSKLLKLKYIHHYFFLKCPMKKSWCVLWSGVSYGPRNTVIVLSQVCSVLGGDYED